jgi:hypothetical protein
MPSTAIEHISYDEAGSELHVKSVGDRTYTYYDVPRSVYEGVRASSSKAPSSTISSRTDTTSARTR